MKNNIFIVCLMAIFSLSSCKNETKSVEPAKEEVKKNSFQLSNYSDSNWDAGVGIEFNMFLADNTPENEALLKSAKELEFGDGTKVKVLGYNIVDKFIQINIEGKAYNFKTLAVYPNYIVAK